MSGVYIKKLTKNDWQSFRAIRLEALQKHPGVYLGVYDDAQNEPSTTWTKTLQSNKCAVFGLFDLNKIIGLASIFTDKNDKTGRTAVLAMGYIQEKYRGQKLSRLLYEARIHWAKSNGNFDKIIVTHRQDNVASKSANQIFGFQFTHEEIITWPDGQTMADCHYVLHLK